MRSLAIAIFVVGTAGCAVAEPAPKPADLRAAPAWQGRSLYTGVVRATAVHTTATLQRAGDRALLTLVVRDSPIRIGGKTPEAWAAPTWRQLTGTFTANTLAYTDGGTAVSLPCAIKTVSVATATAVRVREGKGGCEGDQGKWSPATTRNQKVLVCGDPSVEGASFAFVEPPARPIEYVWINDDCSMQGGGYRDIPKDSSIAPVRAP